MSGPGLGNSNESKILQIPQKKKWGGTGSFSVPLCAPVTPVVNVFTSWQIAAAVANLFSPRLLKVRSGRLFSCA
jgi:hypothetical protein